MRSSDARESGDAREHSSAKGTFLVFPGKLPIRGSAIFVEGIMARESLRSTERRIPLVILPRLYKGCIEIIMFRSGRIFTREEFRALKFSSGAWIETDQPLRIKRLLCLDLSEPGILNISLSGGGS